MLELLDNALEDSESTENKEKDRERDRDLEKTVKTDISELLNSSNDLFSSFYSRFSRCLVCRDSQDELLKRINNPRNLLQ